MSSTSADKTAPLPGWIPAGILAIGTWLVFGQVVGFEFVGWDDELYVGQDLPIRDGLDAGALVWAFSTGHAANWHPLTWLSHMLDFELYGDAPGGHHVTSALLHVLNALLLFGLLRSLTGALWRSALVAALFAWHPLHVESVAWVAERKDVLSTALWLLATWAYADWARRGGRGRYALVAVLLALGLMAKPMLVTLPFVFLLLDDWPLRRLGSGRRTLVQLVVEKIPLLLVCAASSIITFLVQRAGGAVGGPELVPLHLRLANAVAAYAHYLAKVFWPGDLSLYYPHPYIPGSGGVPLAGWQVAEAALLLAAISWIVLRSRRPYARVGWLWYLGTLVPVIGIVQVGGHALADRYTYVPLIGLFLGLVWGAAEAVERLRPRWPWALPVAGVAAGALLVACIATSRAQAHHWRDSVALFEHALAVNPRNRPILFNYGNELRRRGRVEEAIASYRRALAVKPDAWEVHNNLGTALNSQGRSEEALRHFRAALAINPRLAEARANIGDQLHREGRLDEAIEHYRQALRDKPGLAQAHNAIGIALRAQGKRDEAEEQFRQALALDPDYAQAHANLGLVLQSRGELAEAIRHHRRALEAAPQLVAAHHNLGLALAQAADHEAAIYHFREALRLEPELLQTRVNLGKALEAQGKRREAARQYDMVLALDPEQEEARRRQESLARGEESDDR